VKYGRVGTVRKLLQLDQELLSCDIMAGAVALGAADATAGYGNTSDILDEVSSTVAGYAQHSWWGCPEVLGGCSAIIFPAVEQCA